MQLSSIPIRREERGRGANRERRERDNKSQGAKRARNMFMPRMRGRESKHRQEKNGLNLETETFISCAVLNAKHVSAYCRAWLSQPFESFPCL